MTVELPEGASPSSDLSPRTDGGPARGAGQTALERALRVRFRDKRLLRDALVHTSYVNEHPELDLVPNERLEFLGDAVLSAIAAHWLYERHPDAPEGDLTLLRAGLVRQSTLAGWARKVELGRHLLLGRGEEFGGGRERDALLARAFEAVVGALYLDRGYSRVAAALRPFLSAEPDRMAQGRPPLDAKSRLQQLSQSRFLSTPEYQVVEVEGPGHGPTFTVEVAVGPEVRAQGSGPTKQAAQQAAAQAALEQLEFLVLEAGEPQESELPISKAGRSG